MLQFGSGTGEGILWTTELNKELPIFINEENARERDPYLKPETIPQRLEIGAKESPEVIAYRVKRKGKYISYNWKKTYEFCTLFAKALMQLKVPERSTIVLMGFNAPEWAFAFYGTMISNCVPTGIYTTNSSEACEYQVFHCEAKVLVVENQEIL